MGSIPGSGRAPGKGNGNPLQYSCLGNLMDRGAWRAVLPMGLKESDTTWRLNNSKNIIILPLSNPGSGVATGVGREEPRSQPHLTRWLISLPACRQHQPPASNTQDTQHLPDACWLLIRSVSSLRPAGNGQAPHSRLAGSSLQP